MNTGTIKNTKSTREKLLDAAEALFLKKGYEKVNVRELTEVAGVNIASVNYHFKGKRKLYREVLRRKFSDIAKRKVDALSRVINKQEVPELRKIIEVYVSDFLGNVLTYKNAECFLQLISREMSHNAIAKDVLIKELITPVHKVLTDAIQRAQPRIPDEKITLCISSINGQLIHFCRAREIIKKIGGRKYDREFLKDIVEHITDFSIKGLGE
ncbi:putative HTH-type transcriptional regulator YttP [bacterium BMS3Abin06]|nr:putative HTH-type transcriptional regulator YttP [bacterium BMS3Abin06]